MITLLLPFLSSALAAPPAGYTELKTGNDCVVHRGPADANGIAPVYAACTWANVQPDKLHALLGDWAGHAAVHETVVSSKVEKVEGSRSLVYQVHQLSGISNREVRIWMEKKPVTGGFEYAWKNTDPVTPADGNVATAKHVGYWRVTAAPGGGSFVEYALDYDPGGSVPGFLIRWFQAGGTVATTEELRNAALK